MSDFRTSQRKIARRWVQRIGHWLATAGLVALTSASAANPAGFYHTVQPGETLDRIAQRYRVPIYQIARANRIGLNVEPSPGARLWVPGARQASTPKPLTRVVATPAPAAAAPARSTPGIYTVRKGDSLWKIAQNSGTTVDALKSLNGLSGNNLAVGQQLRLPGAEASTPSPAPIRSAPPEATSAGTRAPRSEAAAPAPPRFVQGGMGAGEKGTSRDVSAHGFSWPLEGTVIRPFVQTSQEKHFGINIAAPVGTQVLAAKDGRVAFASESISAYGKMVVIEHADNVATCYAFNDRLLVSPGDRVRRGQAIALSGEGAHDDRPHLHFQVRRNGEAVDPIPYLP
ncbi:MAG: peptidoglycan DD-metalloendopeptidase family protein [Sumerlaeia bacterium]